MPTVDPTCIELSIDIDFYKKPDSPTSASGGSSGPSPTLLRARGVAGPRAPERPSRTARAAEPGAAAAADLARVRLQAVLRGKQFKRDFREQARLFFQRQFGRRPTGVSASPMTVSFEIEAPSSTSSSAGGVASTGEGGGDGWSGGVSAAELVQRMRGWRDWQPAFSAMISTLLRLTPVDAEHTKLTLSVLVNDRVVLIQNALSMSPAATAAPLDGAASLGNSVAAGASSSVYSGFTGSDYFSNISDSIGSSEAAFSNHGSRSSLTPASSSVNTPQLFVVKPPSTPVRPPSPAVSTSSVSTPSASVLSVTASTLGSMFASPAYSDYDLSLALRRYHHGDTLVRLRVCGASILVMAVLHDRYHLVETLFNLGVLSALKNVPVSSDASSVQSRQPQSSDTNAVPQVNPGVASRAGVPHGGGGASSSGSANQNLLGVSVRNLHSAGSGVGEEAVRVESCRGMTPLEVAALLRRRRCAEELRLYCSADEEMFRSLPLCVACRLGDEVAVDLLADRSNVEKGDSAGRMPLHWAVGSANKNIVQRIIKCGAKFDVATLSGETPLHRALYCDHDNMMLKFLLSELKVDPNYKPPDNSEDSTQRASNEPETSEEISSPVNSVKTVLERAIEVNRVSAVDILMAHGAVLTTRAVTLLAQYGRLNTLKSLLENNDARRPPVNWDVNARDARGKTALHRAAENGRDRMCEYLISEGADPARLDLHGRNALHLAADHGHLGVACVLLARAAYLWPEPALRQARFISQRDRYVGAELCFLVRGRDRGRDAHHYLHVQRHFYHVFTQRTRDRSMDVARYGKVIYSAWGEQPAPELVRRINARYAESRLEAPPDPQHALNSSSNPTLSSNPASSSNPAPLSNPSPSSNPNSANSPSEPSAPPLVTAKHPSDLLSQSSNNDRPPPSPPPTLGSGLDCELSNPDDKRPLDMTPLNLALLKGHRKVAQRLLEAGTDAHLADRFGNRPLHLAAMRGFCDVVRHLVLKCNADPTLTNDAHLTAARVAEENEQSACAALLNELCLPRLTQTLCENKFKPLLERLTFEKMTHLSINESSNLRQHVRETLHDLHVEINQFLISIGSAPILDESQNLNS